MTKDKTENAVVPAPIFGGKVSVTDMKSLAQKAAESASNSPRGGAPNGSVYMNFSGKVGVYQIGEKKRNTDEDELWIVDVTSFEDGWVCWKGGQSPASRMANIYNGVPVQQPSNDELGPFDASKGDGWHQAKAMVLRSTDEDQEQAYFKINSVSGVSAMAGLVDAFSDRANAGEPCWPVVALGAEKFESQGFKNFKPVFNIVAWLDNEQLQAIAEGADVNDFLDDEDVADEVEEPAPVAKRGRARRA